MYIHIPSFIFMTAIPTECMRRKKKRCVYVCVTQRGRDEGQIEIERQRERERERERERARESWGGKVSESESGLESERGSNTVERE